MIILDCIQGSYHIPFYCQRIKTLRGIEVVDGAYGFAGIIYLYVFIYSTSVHICLKIFTYVYFYLITCTNFLLSGLDLPHGDETLYVGIDPHAEITRTFTYKEMVRSKVMFIIIRFSIYSFIVVFILLYCKIISTISLIII